MVKKWPKNPKKISKNWKKKGKDFVTLDETHQNITQKNTPKKSFLWPGRAEKGAKKGQKRPYLGTFW